MIELLLREGIGGDDVPKNEVPVTALGQGVGLGVSW